MIEIDGEPPIILDLGSGLRPLGLDLDASCLGSKPLQMSALLTHLHWDHLIGLPFFSSVQRPGNHLDVYGPRQEDLPLEKLVAAVVQPPYFPVSIQDLHGSITFHEAEDGDFAIGSAKVRVRHVPHIGATLGFRVEAGGGSVVYISDHQPPPDRQGVAEGVLELCDGADLLVHDGQYTEEEMVTKGTWGHSTPAYAVHVAAEAGVRRLALYHHDPLHDDDDVDRMLGDARACREAGRIHQVLSAAEGMVLDPAD